MHQIVGQRDGKVAVDNDDRISENQQYPNFQPILGQENQHPDIEADEENAGKGFQVRHERTVVEEVVLVHYFNDAEFSDFFAKKCDYKD